MTIIFSCFKLKPVLVNYFILNEQQQQLTCNFKKKDFNNILFIYEMKDCFLSILDFKLII